MRVCGFYCGEPRNRASYDYVEEPHLYWRNLQNDDGSFGKNEVNKVGLTSLTLLSLLAQGHSPRSGKYGESIKLATHYLCRQLESHATLTTLDTGLLTLALSDAYIINANYHLVAKIKQLGQGLLEQVPTEDSQKLLQLLALKFYSNTGLASAKQNEAIQILAKSTLTAEFTYLQKDKETLTKEPYSAASLYLCSLYQITDKASLQAFSKLKTYRPRQRYLWKMNLNDVLQSFFLYKAFSHINPSRWDRTNFFIDCYPNSRNHWQLGKLPLQLKLSRNEQNFAASCLINIMLAKPREAATLPPNANIKSDEQEVAELEIF